VLLGLHEVLLEDGGERGVLGEARGGAHLGKRLLLDRMGVCQVLDELLLEGRAWHGHLHRSVLGIGRRIPGAMERKR
jgi:hypothetical protein